MPVSDGMLKQLELRERRLDRISEVDSNVDVLQFLIRKYGPDAKVTDVIEAERKRAQGLREAYGAAEDETTCAFSGDPCVPGEAWSNADEKRRREEEERLADEAADRYSDMAADIWDAEGY